MTRHRLTVTIALLAAMAILALALRHVRPATRATRPGPSVVLVTVDTERADHTSTYGYSRPTTPRLDVLAAQGTCFTTAYTAIPSTGPSHAGLFTSRYPSEHGVLTKHRTLPRRMKDSGALSDLRLPATHTPE